MKTLYLDCAMGAAGDMLAAALFEIYPDQPGFLAALNGAGIPGLDAHVEEDARGGIRGSRFRARIGGHGTKVEKLYRLIDGKAEALEFIAREGDAYIGVPLKDLTMRPNSLVAIIVRRGKVIVPFGNDTIESGDSVVIITCESGLSDLNEVIRK